MTLELDHVFVCVEDPVSAERSFADAGLQLGRQGVHEGQGTANACAFFDNAYLELLWRNDDSELQSEAVRPVSLCERLRWRDTGACPFGVAVRSGAHEFPMDTWPYEAPFLPAGADIPIVTPRFLFEEPLLFLSPVSQAPVTLPPGRRPPLVHRGRNRQLTGIVVYGLNLPRLSPGLGVFCERNLLQLESADEVHMELVWDGGQSGECSDFRPLIPLVIRC